MYVLECNGKFISCQVLLNRVLNYVHNLVIYMILFKNLYVQSDA